MGKLATLALVLTACGGGPDLTGFYIVSHQTESDASCVTEGPDQTDVTYFRFTKEEFFGHDYFQLRLCGTADETSCSSAGLYLFAEEIDDGWRARYSTASGGGEFDCFLGFGDATAVQTEEEVRIELRAYSDTVLGLSADACSTDEAENRGTEMPCDSFEVVVGTREEEL